MQKDLLCPQRLHNSFLPPPSEPGELSSIVLFDVINTDLSPLRSCTLYIDVALAVPYNMAFRLKNKRPNEDSYFVSPFTTNSY